MNEAPSARSVYMGLSWMRQTERQQSWSVKLTIMTGGSSAVHPRSDAGQLRARSLGQFHKVPTTDETAMTHAFSITERGGGNPRDGGLDPTDRHV